MFYEVYKRQIGNLSCSPLAIWVATEGVAKCILCPQFGEHFKEVPGILAATYSYNDDDRTFTNHSYIAIRRLPTVIRQEILKLDIIELVIIFTVMIHAVNICVDILYKNVVSIPTCMQP